MRGGGTKLQTIANSRASAHLLDVTRTVSRAHWQPTGIDRIERAYIARLIDDPAPLFGLVRTKLGYLLLDKSGCRSLLEHCETQIWQEADLLSRLSRRSDADRARTETGLRRIALDRATPARLTAMLKRHLPPGTAYLNTGQTQFNDRIISALKACEDVRISVYLHDTIPLDFPEVQTNASRLRFKQFFTRTARHADLVLCNSEHTKSRVLYHADHLKDDQVHVVMPGVPDIKLGTAPKGPWSDEAYVMAIGTIEPRKNIGFLLDLWDTFSGPDDPHLVICGRRGWMSEDVFARLDRHPPNVHELSGLPDSAMWALLKDSCGLLFPSKAEGFGYPAIEAIRLQVPVICTPLPVFREVLGNSAIYADESDRYLWRNKVEQLTQGRRGQSGEQYSVGSCLVPTWQEHFNLLFTLL